VERQRGDGDARAGEQRGEFLAGVVLGDGGDERDLGAVQGGEQCGESGFDR
jgi:hypothetical protein